MESLELRTRDGDATEPENVATLPPADGGKQAWLFLAGAFMIEALVWGFPFSFGVFQEYYATHEPFASQSKGLAAVGTTASGVMYMSAPIVMAVLGRYPHLRRSSIIVGLGISALALVASSFSQTVIHLILLQGLGYAIGGSLMYPPALLYLDEWFVKRKGLAYGIMWAGTGTSGAVIPLIMNVGLERWGFRTMLRAWGLSMVILSGPLLVFVKPRLPVVRESGPKKINLEFLRGSTFWWLQAGNILQGLGFFIPAIYLPTYAASLGLPHIVGSLSVSLINATSVFGTILLGSLCDRTSVTNVILLCAIGSGLAVFLLWGFSMSVPLLILFSIVYGFFAGGYTTIYSGAVAETARVNPTDKGVIMGMFSAGRGVGNLIAGPLSEKLLSVGTGNGVYAYGGQYAALIVFTGTMVLSSSLSWGGLGLPRLVRSMSRSQRLE